MEIPIIIKALVAAQAENNSAKYIDCFSETAIVHDEGQLHSGKRQIRQWNEKTSREYQMTWQPLAYDGTDKKGVLTTKVTGTFPGSPITMQFHFEMEGGLIQSIAMKG